MRLQGLRAIGIAPHAEPRLALSETAPFPAPVASTGISEGEKMTIEHQILTDLP